MRRRRGTRPPPRALASELIGEPEGTLVDLIDGLLEKGVVVDGEVVLGLADVDLIYVRLGALLVAADRLIAPVEGDQPRRARKRRRR